MRGLIGMGAVCAVLVAASGAAGAVTTEAVLDSPAYEVEPYVGNGYFAWAQAGEAHPARFNVSARPDAGARFKVNPKGTVGFATDIDSTTLVFTQRSRPSAAGNVRFYDLVGRAVSNPPAGVNTRRYNEAGGKLLGNTLLFARYSRSAVKIFLFDLVAHQRKLLDSISRPGYAQTADVDGGLAAWIKCKRFAHCQTFVYDLTLADDGTVYFGESSNINCGNSLAVWRWDVGGAREKLFDFQSNRDIAVTTPVENLDGSTTIYYDRFNCNTGAADIFKTTITP